jgi:hypothetical protein
MGQEALCTVRFGDKVSSGRALLESHELLFRGDFRLAIPFDGMQSIKARDGTLTVRFSDGVASFDLGARAERWAEKIRRLGGLMDKLGVKPCSKVAVLGVNDSSFCHELSQRGAQASVSGATEESDLIFYAADRQEDLQALPRLRENIKSNGAIWVISPKGRQAPLKGVEVIAAAKSAGLVDVKVASFSETHTALKLIVPRGRR